MITTDELLGRALINEVLICRIYRETDNVIEK
jgi:hypothetical protein